MSGHTPRELFITMARVLLRGKLVVPGPSETLFLKADIAGAENFKKTDGSQMFKSVAEVFATAAEVGRGLKIPVGSISKLLIGTITLEKLEEAEATLSDIASAVLDDDKRAFEEELQIGAAQARVEFFGEPGRTPQPMRDKKTEARDKWIYEECCKGTPHKKIMAQLAKKKTWRHISSKQGVPRAAERYAVRHNLPIPPKRLA